MRLTLSQQPGGLLLPVQTRNDAPDNPRHRPVMHLARSCFVSSFDSYDGLADMRCNLLEKQEMGMDDVGLAQKPRGFEQSAAPDQAFPRFTCV